MLPISRTLLGMTALLSLLSCRTQEKTYAPTAEDNLTMRKEADAFLRNMPAGLQRRQAQAVREAIAGDSRQLNAVRKSRDTPPDTPAHVNILTLTPSLRLYQAAGRQTSKLPLLIYMHGGGWTFGSLNSCSRFCNAMAGTGRMKVLAVDYRLAPEHPFPAGLDDCIAAVSYAGANAALLGIDESLISIGGDSSGGNLALAAALSPRCKGKIRSLVLFYPVTKAFEDGTPSWRQYGAGYGLDADIMREFNRAYLSQTHPADPRVSVALCADTTLNRLPPTLLIAAGRDILRDQGEELARRAAKRITRVEFPEAVHLFITVGGQNKAFDKAVEIASDFIQRQKGR